MKKFVLLGTAAALLAPASAALAQEVSESDQSSGGLNEIIVTATKRSENLQDVPISVLATTGQALENRAVTNVEEITATMPAVTIAQSPIGSFVFIRGLGTPGVNQGVEHSASMFHDGIYMGRSQLSRAPIMDVERVEVLRGPQSILFGKNTIAGAIHIINRKPTDDFEGSVSGLYGSHGETEFTGVLSGPLANGLNARVSFRKYDIDGWLRNVMTGKKGPSADDWTLRGQLEFEPTETIRLSAKWEHSEFKRGEPSTQLNVVNPFTPTAAAFSGLNSALVAAASPSSLPEKYDRERAVVNDGGALLGRVAPVFAGLPGFPDLPEFSTNDMDVGSLTAEIDIGDHTLTSISGYARYKYRDICDCDFAAVPLIQVDARESYKQYSQELRLASPQGQAIEYILGGYYHKSKVNFNSVESFGSSMAYTLLGLPTPLLLPNLTRDYAFKQDQEMWSLFGQATWNASDATRLIVGLRWFKDDKSASHVLDKRFTGGWDYSALAALPAGTIAFGSTAADYDRFLASTFGTTPIAPGAPTPGFLTEAVYASLLGTSEHNVSRSRSEKKVNWNVTFQQDLADDVMAYASVSTGTKGGGFDARFLRNNSSPFFEYGPESATSYEAGLKTKLFDNTVRFNITAFRVDVKDFQVSIFDGATAFLVVNAAKARSQGIEIDASWAPVSGLTIDTSASILDAKWTSFPSAPCWASPPTAIRDNCVNFGTPNAFRDATGDALLFAPKFSANVTVNYQTPITDSMKLGLSVNLNHSSSYYIAGDGDPIYGFQPSYQKIDARLSLGHIDNKWEIALLGKNLTNTLTSGNGNDEPLVPGNGFTQTDRTRSFAVQGRFKF